MKSKNKSPQIKSIAWGKVRVENNSQTFKDVKLYPGGCHEWDWSETGTHHTPGIQPADLKELRDQGSTTVILSKGMNERLKTSGKAKHFLENHNIEYRILQTHKAVEAYNDLCNKEPVGALIHSTC